MFPKPSLVACLNLVFGFTSLVVDAHAETPDEERAQKLSDEAIQSDYLSTRFEDSAGKLEQAIRICARGVCAASVVARLRLRLGVVYAAGMDRPGDGEKQFRLALRADPSIRPPSDLTTPLVEKVFARALEGSPAVSGKDEDEGEVEPGLQTDLVVHPPARQAVSTPVPVFVRVGDGTSFDSVEIHYVPVGGESWETLNASRVSDGWGIEIPCEHAATTGALRFYVTAYSSTTEMGAEAGSRADPYEVEIVRRLTGARPHLPERPAPEPCLERGDCPPDFPGCGEDGIDGPVESNGAEPRRNWLSVGFQQDLLFLGSAREVCDNETDYACFRSEDAYYEIVPRAGSRGEIEGGISLATSRVLVGYERLFGENITLGARVGYAFGGGPTAPGRDSFLPFHAELRGQYWFGAAPFSGGGIRPFVGVSGGIAQVDGAIDVRVFDDETAFENDELTDLRAWRKSGTGFASAGGGLAVALTSAHALTVEARWMQMLGFSASAAGINLGYALGL